MFNRIAHRYDYLNHFLSLGIDRLWRRRLRKDMKRYKPMHILDVATGTADLAIELAKLKPQKIVGVDIAEVMLQMGDKKLEKKKLNNLIHLQQADSENLPFEDNSFDAAAVSYGVRNFETPVKGLSEIRRVLKPGGVLMILEFGMPDTFPVKQGYSFYFNFILPLWGKVFSGSYESYKYLPESVKTFPYADDFNQLLLEAGFSSARAKKLSFGITYLYEAVK